MKRRWIFSLLTASLVTGMVGTSYAEVKISGGEFRLRGVMVDNGDGTAPTSGPMKDIKDGGFFEQRTRLNVDASVDDNAKVFIQVQDSRMWGGERSTTDTGEDIPTTCDSDIDDNNTPFEDTDKCTSSYVGIDLSQGYVELSKLFGSPVSLKIGRQAMAYGEHRLIGSLEWTNNARRFDAIKGTVKLGDAADIDFWTAKVSDSGEDWGNDGNFNGVYASVKMIPKNTVDIYLLQKISGGKHVSASGATPGTSLGDTNKDMNIYTIGGRVKGAVENISIINIDYTGEFALQSGDFDEDSSQSAHAYA